MSRHSRLWTGACTLVVFWAMSAPGRSQTPPWTSTGPFGARVTDIEFRPAAGGQRFLVGGPFATPHSTDNAGTSFSAIPEASRLPPFVRDFASLGQFPGFYLAANDQDIGRQTGGLFRSTDDAMTWLEDLGGVPLRGKNWHSVAISPNGTVLAVNASPQAGEQGIYQGSVSSSDWKRKFAMGGGRAVEFSASTPTVAFACFEPPASAPGTYITVDSGETWVLADASSPDYS